MGGRRPPFGGQAPSDGESAPLTGTTLRGASQESAPGRPEGHRELSDIQRARIVAAMVDVASERGAGNATVARVVARSGVSRRTFYEQFADREECFLAAFDETVRRCAAAIAPAYETPGRWRARMRASLIALLEFLDREPTLARVLIAESLGGGPRALERRQNVFVSILPLIDEGRVEAKAGDAPPPLTAEGVLGGVLSLIHTRLLAPRDGGLAGESPLVELAGALTAMVVLPYLGPAAARRELSRPVPSMPSAAKRAAGDPLRDLDMRLTYRTIRVLLAIGELGGRGPYPSNRQVADAAGIRDQGQVSKLLARLAQLGLIENAGESRVKGEPNAWRLTERGAEVRGVLGG
jgi:AcrR family transcriptional regulator